MPCPSPRSRADGWPERAVTGLTHFYVWYTVRGDLRAAVEAVGGLFDAIEAHPRYAVVLAANRDEYHARAALPAAWWNDDDPILAGRDCVAGGTWLGVSRRGRYAFVTNVREPGRHDPGAATRGTLVPRVL